MSFTYLWAIHKSGVGFSGQAVEETWQSSDIIV